MCVQCTYMDDSLQGECRAARKAVEGEGLQRWCVGCRSGDKRQRSVCSVCTIHVRGRVAPGKCRGSEDLQSRQASVRRILRKQTENSFGT